MSEYWGFESTHDCLNGDKSLITSKDNIIAFTKALVEAIDMKAYGEPLVVYFAEHDASKAGYSLVQLIETSSITGHFVDSTGEFYLNIFSCKNFDATVVNAVIQRYFKPENIKTKFYLRKA
jgi:S-adenosylmethionine/arginine decarboxylase-like enzyme